MKTKVLVAAGLAGCALAWAAKDPVIMTINGVDVKKSEFEYLYNKNKTQQLSEQTFDEYVEMFKTYKLKVVDAKAEGIDTTAQFKNEFRQYRKELAEPYKIDSVYFRKLCREAYDRLGEEVEVSHIMIRRTGPSKVKAMEKIDSISQEIENGASFEELATKYSEDRGSAQNGGYLGYFTSLVFPYNFETTAYNMKEGEISKPVESPVGFHIIKVGKRRPARGSVSAQHILRLVDVNATPEQQIAVKNTIDSLYQCALLGDDFSELATKYSEDRGSKGNGGNLGWFGAGRMIAEFDSAAFAIEVGEVSHPVRTRYGWHIIKKTGKRPVASYDEMLPMIESKIRDPRDERSRMIIEHQLQLLAKEYGLKENKKMLSNMRNQISINGLDSIFFEKFWAENKEPLFTYDKKQIYSVSEFLKVLQNIKTYDKSVAAEYFERQLQTIEYKTLSDYDDLNFENKYPEFRNLINEYRDGILLFDVSSRKVWDRAAQDTEGLKTYFENHRNEYKWNVPHVKGWLVQTSNDTIAQQVKQRMDGLENDSILKVIRSEFPKTVKIDRVLVAKGENPMIDNLVFGADPVQPANSAYTTYFLHNFVVLNSPEEYEDVRGQVTSDYQNQLEDEWVEELKNKYSVVLNEKELRKIAR